MPDVAHRLVRRTSLVDSVYFELHIGEQHYTITPYGDNQWCASAVLREANGRNEIGQVTLFAKTPELVAQALVRLEQGQREAMREWLTWTPT